MSAVGMLSQGVAWILGKIISVAMESMSQSTSTWVGSFFLIEVGLQSNKNTPPRRGALSTLHNRQEFYFTVKDLVDNYEVAGFYKITLVRFYSRSFLF